MKGESKISNDPEIKDKYFLDTNALLNYADKLKNLDNIYISSISLEELENIKTSNRKDEEIKFLARRVVRILSENQDKLNVIPLQDNHYSIIESVNLKPTNDNLIIASAVKENTYNEVIFITDDLLCEIFAKNFFNLRVEKLSNDEDDEYKGYKEVYIDNQNEKDSKWLAGIYENPKNNPCNLYENEYLIVRDKKNKKIIDKLRYTSDGIVTFNNKTLNSKIIGKIKPLDIYQSCLIDSLINNKMSLVRGKAGTGKSLLCLAYSLSMIESGKYEKLIVFCNPLSSRNSGKLGFYPGSRLEKILDSFVGSMFSSKLGGMEGVYQLIERGSLEILPFSDIRGYDTSGTNSIVYIIEAQNLNIDLMKLAIQRVSDDCKLIIDGDDNSQVDMIAYEGLNNGMKRVSEVFRGKNFYGEIELQEIYRSKIAQIANLM